MGLVFIDHFFYSQIPYIDIAVFWPWGQDIFAPIQTSNPPYMLIPARNFPFFYWIHNFDLPKGIAHSQQAISTKTHWTYILAAALIDFFSVCGVMGPDVQFRFQSHSDVIVLRPVQEIKVEVVLKIWRL